MAAPASSTASAGKKISARWLPAILLLALALRLCYFGWAQSYALGYQTDSIEAYEVAATYDAGGPRAQYIGQPNCNPHSKLPGPLWTLFCLAGIKLTGTPDGIALLTILVNIVAIALTWRLAREVGGVTAANLGTLLLAVSLWAVQYASIVWNPSVMPLFGAVILLALFRCLRQKNSRAIFFISWLVLTGAQFHMSTLSLIVPLIIFIWVTRVQPNWRWLAAGVAVAGLGYIPYVLGDMRHDWANTRGILFGGQGKFSPDALKVFSSPFTFLINLWNPGWTYAPGEYPTLAHRAFGGMPGMITVNVLSVIFAILVVLGIVLVVQKLIKNRPATLRTTLAGPPSPLTVLFLLSIYLAFALVAGKPFHSRYCLLVLPLIFVLAGCGAAQCLQMVRLKKFFLPLLLFTVVADIWFMGVICRSEQDRIATGVAFVPSCAKMETVYQQLKTRAPGWIEVRDNDYYKSIPAGESNNIYRHACLISHYIRARELELLAKGTTFTQTNRFDLRAASLVNSNDPAVVYYGNGITLMTTLSE